MMRFSLLCVIFVVLFLISVSCSTAWAAAENVAEYSVGKATVWAIADSKGDRDASVFPGADPDVISQYMPSGKCPSAIMTFLVKVESEIILIDTGLGASAGERASQLLEGLNSIGVTTEEITKILITHMHGDHIGGLVKDGKKVFPSARVLSSSKERDFWLGEKSAELFPNYKSGIEMAQGIFELYGDAYETFEFDAEVAAGIRAIDARGHTPGHTLFMLESEGERLLFWADLTHAAALQFPRPDISASYDMNPEEAAAVRARYMEIAAVGKIPIAGIHLPFPGVGMVEKNAEGGYVYISR